MASTAPATPLAPSVSPKESQPESSASLSLATSTLSELGVGDSAVVVRVDCDRRTRLRLLEMGLVPGTPFTVRRRAPLGDPIELRVRDYALTVRGSDASAIVVEVVSARGN